MEYIGFAMVILLELAVFLSIKKLWQTSNNKYVVTTNTNNETITLNAFAIRANNARNQGNEIAQAMEYKKIINSLADIGESLHSKSDLRLVNAKEPTTFQIHRTLKLVD